MIVQFFNRGSGSGAGSVDYLLGKDRDRDQAKLLRGHDLETVELINSLDFDKRYTSGCLSFEESNLDEDLKRELMDEFEETLFPGMDKNQYSCLWVEHRDKGRLELNFVIPNVELTTGKRLQPYYVGADYHRVDAWKQIKNIEHDFTDPNDPGKAQSTIISKDLPRDKKDAVEMINQALERAVVSGIVTNRESVVQYLEESGVEIARESKQSISIKNPDGGRNIRLKGAIYERDFQFSRALSEEIRERSRDYQSRVGERLSGAQERYQYGIEKRREYLEQRYGGVDRGGEVEEQRADRSEVRSLQALSRSSRELVESIPERVQGNHEQKQSGNPGNIREELKIDCHGDLSHLAHTLGVRVSDSARNDRVWNVPNGAVEEHLPGNKQSESDFGNIERSNEWNYDQELYGREWDFALRSAESEVQGQGLDGQSDRGNTENYQYEGIGNDDRDTAIIIECINEFNQRVSEAKQRTDRERESADRRLRAIAERSDDAKRHRAEYAEVVNRELAEKPNPGITSELIDRAKCTINRTIKSVSDYVQKIIECKSIHKIKESKTQSNSIEL